MQVDISIQHRIITTFLMNDSALRQFLKGGYAGEARTGCGLIARGGVFKLLFIID